MRSAPGIPVHDVPVGVEHEDGVVGDALDQKPEAPLGLLELRKAAASSCALCRALLERFVQAAAAPARPASRRNFPLAGLVEARIVDRDGGLRRQSRDNAARRAR